MRQKTLKLLLLFTILTTFDISHANQTKPIIDMLTFNQIMNCTHQSLQDTNMKLTPPFLVAGILCFMAASISSAGGIGGGGLFIPILTIVAGLNLKTASSFSAFMVTGGSIANVACHMFVKSTKHGSINYDITLLSEPCMLLGVSLGVLCHLVLPEWLITILFAIFLAWSTFKTCKSGICYWKLESEVLSRNMYIKSETGAEDPLLNEEPAGLKSDIPWMKLMVLVMVWFSFFVLYLLRGNRYGQGYIHIEACGVGYWIISSLQIPLAIIFTTWILCSKKSLENNVSSQQETGAEIKGGPSENFMFPIMALLAGVLGGVFGIGGGMLISPLLLQMGIKPEVTAATCSFMVFFSSTMSAIQYLLLGMEHIYGALIFAVICFTGSLVGLILVQRAIIKHGRSSLIVFSVGTVMAFSTVLMTSFGAVDVWRDYTSGKSMGFKKPC
ncbi:Sulfite exporter TauE/SafE family protein [Abeliophyllum distichum]|uniref:Sulfite exporter TauE/SafE family protein n=1 Tax=Abeliophyllum distichum TaxID=126358 RepID=A0ABD1UG24_9LAMI